ncbi:MAG: gamma-glutamyltransferase, partial [bacterium]|nr:gamma-glutamyltransferase [bacterium]
TILTNPPPSSGGALIALCLELLQDIPMPPEAFQSEAALNALVAAMQITNSLREQEYDRRLHETGFAAELLSASRLSRYREWHRALLAGKTSPPLQDFAGGPSSTTHISAIDGQGNAASLTASNGEGSGIFIPATGMMVNNMLGEEDLNPAGFHRHAPGTRISSMMSPTIVLKGKDPVAVLGSGGSNRIRSAITQSIMNLIDFGKGAKEAVDAPRIHWERGLLNQEPGFQAFVAPHLCPRENRILWKATNLFFGGVHVVTGDPAARTFGGAGDHRRGGVAIVVDENNGVPRHTCPAHIKKP